MSANSPYIIGLTGGIGTGKSEAAKFLASLGAVHLDADAISHELTQPGGEALAAETLNAVYAKLNAAYYPQVRQDALIAYEWMRIPHFYNAFYVYKYATGFSAAMALAEGIRTEGAAAVERYKKFLSLGSSVPPLEALRVAGVDMEKPEAVDRALDAFDALVENGSMAACKEKGLVRSEGKDYVMKDGDIVLFRFNV